MKNALYGGVNAAALTAMTADLVPDLDRTAAHCAWLLANGCSGLGVLGTTGEAASFGFNERQAIVEGLISRGIPAAKLMPGTGCASLTDTVELTKHARDAGCPGVLMLPPFYYKNPTEDALFAYYSEVVNRVGGGVAIYLYHFPAQSAVPITLGLIERLLKAFPTVIRGAKDSSGDYANSKAMIDAFAKDGFEVYPAADDLFQRMLADGAAGSLTACANANARFAATVYAKRTGPEADAAQAVLTATRKAAQSVPLVAGLREIIARSRGDEGYRHIRPPQSLLTPAQADAVWAGWEAAGALPLPGLSLTKAAE